MCVWEGNPSLGLSSFGGGAAQRTLVLGVANALMWKTDIFLFNKLLVITSWKENDVWSITAVVTLCGL